VRRGLAPHLRFFKKVGSNYFLENRRLQPEYKSPGWQALAAVPSAARAQPKRADISNLLHIVDNIRKVFQETTEYVYIPDLQPRLAT